jgi:opacity protein-like surface antigen
MRVLPLCLLLLGAVQSAFARPVAVQSIKILPSETTIGRYPEITGSIQATRALARGETLNITVIAVVVQPDHVVKSWTWKKVIMRTGEIRSFTIPKKYDVHSAGTYKVDFNVYASDMSPLHRLSKTFIAVNPSLPPGKTETQEENGSRIQMIPSGQAALSPEESRHIGLGVYANTLNSSGGATMILWPFRYIGVQGSYAAGSYTIAEVRLLARIPRSSGISPYLGVGYLHVATERSVEIIGIKSKFQDSGLSVVIGAEIPLSRGLFGYAEIERASIDLKKEVASGSITGNASVKFAPVTIGIGLVYFLF